MAEAVQEIDSLRAQLTFARKTCDELVALVDSLRSERDTWRTATGR
jgi:hypothetical protein